jgi:hypothetical protein
MARKPGRRPRVRAGVLVRYRVFGGPADIDQRLTVFEDGAVELDERHRSRDPIWVRMDATELEGLRAALEELPSTRWSHPARAALARAWRNLLPDLLGGAGRANRAGTELRRGGRVILGAEAGDGELDAVVAPLDAVRVRAVRAEPR